MRRYHRYWLGPGEIANTITQWRERRNTIIKKSCWSYNFIPLCKGIRQRLRGFLLSLSLFWKRGDRLRWEIFWKILSHFVTAPLQRRTTIHKKKDEKNLVPTSVIEPHPSFCDFPCQNCVMLSIAKHLKILRLHLRMTIHRKRTGRIPSLQ